VSGGPETSYQSPPPTSAEKINWRSLLGLLPATMLFALAYASFYNHIWWDDYTPLGYVWVSCGVALVVAAVLGIGEVDVREKSPETSLLMFGWGCSDAITGGTLVLAWQFLPYSVSLGLFYALMTVLLMHLGAVVLVWGTLTGIFGAYAKAFAVAMGSAAMVVAGVYAFLIATTIIFT